MRPILFSLVCVLTLSAQQPGPQPKGYSLPNGWRITPLGKAIPTEDLLLNLVVAPDRKSMIATHGGFNPHGLVVVDLATEEKVQSIPLPSAWLGLAFSPDGKRFFVSGGNAAGRRNQSVAPIYVFDYANGRLSAAPVAQWRDTAFAADRTYWSGLAHHPTKPLLYAANRGSDPLAGHIAVFDSTSGKVVERIQVETTPYDLLLSPDGSKLFVSNCPATPFRSSTRLRIA